MYTKEKLKEIAAKEKDSNVNISPMAQVSEAWNKLDSDQKEVYVKMAKEASAEYQKKIVEFLLVGI